MTNILLPRSNRKKPYFLSRVKRWKGGKRRKQKKKRKKRRSKERFLRHTFHFSSRTRELFIQNLSKSHLPLSLSLSLSLFKLYSTKKTRHSAGKGSRNSWTNAARVSFDRTTEFLVFPKMGWKMGGPLIENGRFQLNNTLHISRVPLSTSLLFIIMKFDRFEN